MRHKTFIIAVAACVISGVHVLCVVGCDVRGASPPPTAVQPISERQWIDAVATAEKALDDGRLDDAVRLARFASDRRDNAASQELLGRALVAQASMLDRAGKTAAATEARAAAAKAYGKAAAYDETNAGLQHAAAMILDSAGAADDALRLYDRAVLLAPTNPVHLLHRGNARLRGNDLAGAASDADALFAIAAEDPWTFAFRAEVRLAQGRTADAVADATIARSKAPSDLGFRSLLARCLRLHGQASDAVELLMALPPSQRGELSIGFELALAWQALDRNAKAGDAWAAVYHADPHSARTALRSAVEAGHAYLRSGDRMAASSWLELARLLDPSDQRVQDLASALGGAGEKP